MRAKYWLVICLSCIQSIKAEPWIDTRDSWLRADIEMLADIGVIKVPITTYPLMWSGIIKDLDNTSIENIPWSHKDIFWRVKTASKQALKKTEHKELKLFYSTSVPTLNSYGDVNSGKSGVSARKYGLNNNVAWNFEFTHGENIDVSNKNNFDGSYFSFVTGNWITSIGAIDRWWGPGVVSSNILGNQERPSFGVNLQRNYSNQDSSFLFSWLGPWTLNSFVAELNDDSTYFSGAKFSGLSFNFKPHLLLDVGVRVVTIFDELNNDEISSRCYKIDLESIISCAHDSNFIRFELSNKSLADDVSGIDLRWRLPIEIPASFYASYFSESKNYDLPAKKIQLGVSSMFNIGNTNWRWFVEFSEDKIDGISTQDYENYSFKNSYSFPKRHFDLNNGNKSRTNSFGINSVLNKYNQFNFIYSCVESISERVINFDSLVNAILKTKQNIKQIKLSWLYQVNSNNSFNVSGVMFDDNYKELNMDENTDKYRFSISWVHNIF